MSRPHSEDAWKVRRAAYIQWAVYGPTITQVSNKERSKDLIFCGVAFKDINRHNFVSQLHVWDGLKDIYVSDFAWLSAFSTRLIGHVIDEASGGSLDCNRTCLVSDRGWSTWILVLAHTDPICLLMKEPYPFVQEFFAAAGSESPTARYELLRLGCEYACCKGGISWSSHDIALHSKNPIPAPVCWAHR